MLGLKFGMQPSEIYKMTAAELSFWAKHARKVVEAEQKL